MVHIAKYKGEREIYTRPNAEFQRIGRRDKKTFLSEQCKEIEESNRTGKTKLYIKYCLKFMLFYFKEESNSDNISCQQKYPCLKLAHWVQAAHILDYFSMIRWI